jgi:isopropylmalate/homocitrate/citramalate synthase
MPSTESAVSPLNFLPEVRAEYPERVTIADVTLREGEQAAEVSFSKEEKLMLARRLDEIGVGQIEVGWPSRVQQDREVLLQLKRERLRAKTQALATLYGEGWRTEVDAALDSGADVVALLHATSDLRLRHSERIDRERLLDKVGEAVTYAVGRGPLIAFTPVDAPRTDLAFLEKVVRVAVDAGAGRVILPDTVGGAGPEAIYYLVKQVTRWVDVPVHVHCHNDFGLACANALAAVRAGASIIDVAVNGLGERSGNPRLDELAVSLELLYGVDTGIDLSRLTDLSRFVSQISGLPLPFNKPLVGEYAFSHKLDLHVKRVLEHPPVFEALAPEVVGNRRVFPLGRHVGPFVIRLKLRDLGLDATDEQVARLVALVEERAVQTKRAVDDEAFAALAREVLDGAAK